MASTSKKLQKRLEQLLARLVIGGLGFFPLRMSMALGKWFGGIVPAILPRLRRTASRNLEIAMPDNTESENRKILKGTFMSIGRHLGLVSHFRHFEKADLRNLVEIVGKENFFEAQATGRGILFITGHFGSWEVFNLLPPAFDQEINILVRRIDNELVEDYVDSLRTKFGSVTLGKKEAPRKMYRLLEDGKILGILADLNAQLHDGVFVDFFGVLASTTTSIAKLALKTNAVILPAFAVWDEKKAKYVVYLEPPIDFESTEDQRSDILEITKNFTSVIERYVRKYPDQWLWIHKRWNTRPKGEKSLY